MESWNHLGWKRSSWSPSPAIKLTFWVQSLNHVPRETKWPTLTRCPIYMWLKQCDFNSSQTEVPKVTKQASITGLNGTEATFDLDHDFSGISRYLKTKMLPGLLIRPPRSNAWVEVTKSATTEWIFVVLQCSVSYYMCPSRTETEIGHL